MTVAVTTLRTSIASALSNAGVWDTFSYVPATPTANSVVLRYADPMLEPSNNKYNIGVKANFTITCIVPMLDNQASIIALEEMVCAVFLKLSASTINFTVESVSAPAVLQEAQEMMTSTININTMTTWS
jgi:hypothetical protein